MLGDTINTSKFVGTRVQQWSWSLLEEPVPDGGASCARQYAAGSIAATGATTQTATLVIPICTE